MDNILINDLALAFQLVSDKEKRKQKSYSKSQKRSFPMFWNLKGLGKKKKTKMENSDISPAMALGALVITAILFLDYSIMIFGFKLEKHCLCSNLAVYS